MSLSTSLEAFIKDRPWLNERMGYVFELGTYLRYLVKPRREPKQKFIIFGSGRNGSTLLVSLLDSTSSIFCDNEIYHRKVLFNKTYRRARARIANKDVYGYKLLTYHISLKMGIPNEQFTDHLRELQAEGYKIIHLMRYNFVRQALSNLYARHRGQFHSNSTVGKKTDNKMTVKLDELGAWIRNLEDNARWELSLVADLPHLSLSYEADLEDKSAHLGTLRRVSQFLGVTVEPPTTELRKVTPESLESFVENADEVMAYLRQNNWAHYLEPQSLPQA